MNYLVNLIIALIVAIVVYVVLSAIIHFSHAHLIFGLVALAIFLLIGFGGGNVAYTSRWRR